MTRRYRRGALAVFVAAAAIGLAACGGSGSTPHVASLGNSSGDGSGNSAGSGNGSGNGTGSSADNPTQLLDEWAACMRKHGDPNQTDPTIDASKGIHIFMTDVSQALSSEVHSSSGPCSNYELAAEKALQGGQSAPKGPNPAQLVKYAECMRANGVPSYPDPNGSQEQDIGNVDPNSAIFKNANQVCAKKIGAPAWWANGTGVPGEVEVQSFNGPPGATPPPGGPGSNGGSGASG